MTALTGVQSGICSDVELVLGYQDILWLAGQVFLYPEFVAQADEEGLPQLYARCPYSDLTEDQRQVFQRAFHHPRLREVVHTWWERYEEALASGEIPDIAHRDKSSLNSSGQDLARLIGLLVLRRGFVAEASIRGLDFVFAHEIAYGDLTEYERSAFNAILYHPHLREVIQRWWVVYDRARQDEDIISPFEYWNPV